VPWPPVPFSWPNRPRRRSAAWIRQYLSGFSRVDAPYAIAVDAGTPTTEGYGPDQLPDMAIDQERVRVMMLWVRAITVGR
jgi:hypothetical protein